VSATYSYPSELDTGRCQEQEDDDMSNDVGWAPATLDDLVRRAGFVFIGTIQQLASTTLAQVPTSEQTALVRVDEYLHGPRLLAAYTGRDITLQLREPRQVHVEHQALFFASGWVYAEGIGLREIGHLALGAVAADISTLRERLAEARRRVADQDLQRRIAGAALVVVGRVTQTATVERAERRPRREHDPDWLAATLAVDSVVREERSEQQTVVVLFPSSTDIAWRAAPKFTAGQSGIWLLRKQLIRELDQEAYTALDPQDYQPLDQRARLEALLPGI
jgi:hypothetical protein